MNLRKTITLATLAALAGATALAADTLTIDKAARELRITAVTAKDCSQPAVCDWGKRGQAFFGCRGGKMEPFFIFVTDVGRAEIDKAFGELGVGSRRQIPKTETAKHQGLKGTTQKEDYLDGDPILIGIRFQRNGETVEAALEDFIEEKIIVEGQEVVKPYTPHWVYHGTGEAIGFPSGCIACPSDCNGGIITDNALPLLTTTSQFKVDWTKMPAPGTKVEVVLKSVRSGPRAIR